MSGDEAGVRMRWGCGWDGVGVRVGVGAKFLLLRCCWASGFIQKLDTCVALGGGQTRTFAS